MLRPLWIEGRWSGWPLEDVEDDLDDLWLPCLWRVLRGFCAFVLGSRFSLFKRVACSTGILKEEAAENLYSLISSKRLDRLMRTSLTNQMFRFWILLPSPTFLSWAVVGVKSLLRRRGLAQKGQKDKSVINRKLKKGQKVQKVLWLGFVRFVMAFW